MKRLREREKEGREFRGRKKMKRDEEVEVQEGRSDEGRFMIEGFEKGIKGRIRARTVKKRTREMSGKAEFDDKTANQGRFRRTRGRDEGMKIVLTNTR